MNEARGEYYLHQFYSEQPDLNLRNPKVVAQLKEVLAFWLDLGVDGFRIDAAAHFFEGNFHFHLFQKIKVDAKSTPS